MSKINILSTPGQLPVVELPPLSTDKATPTTSVRAMVRLASICLLLYWGAIFVATHLPGKSLPKLQFSDKAYHAIAFAGLSFLLSWAIPLRKGKFASHLILTFSVATIYAGLDELTQTLIPSRTCDLWDFAADVVGISIGMSTYLLLRSCLLSFSWGRGLIRSLSR